MAQSYVTISPRPRDDDSLVNGNMSFPVPPSPPHYPPPPSMASMSPTFVLPHDSRYRSEIEEPKVTLTRLERSDNVGIRTTSDEFDNKLSDPISSIMATSDPNQQQVRKLHVNNGASIMKCGEEESDVRDILYNANFGQIRVKSPICDTLNSNESFRRDDHTTPDPNFGRYPSNTIASISKAVGVSIEMIVKTNPHLIGFDPYNDALSIGTPLEIPDIEEAYDPPSVTQPDECSPSQTNMEPCSLSTDFINESIINAPSEGSLKRQSFEMTQVSQYRESIFEVSIATETLVEDILALNPHLRHYPIDKPLPLMTRIQLPNQDADEGTEREGIKSLSRHSNSSSRYSGHSRVDVDKNESYDIVSDIKPVELFTRTLPGDILVPLSDSNASLNSDDNAHVEMDSPSSEAPPVQLHMSQIDNSLSLQNRGFAINLESIYSPDVEQQIRSHGKDDVADDGDRVKLQIHNEREVVVGCGGDGGHSDRLTASDTARVHSEESVVGKSLFETSCTSDTNAYYSANKPHLCQNDTERSDKSDFVGHRESRQEVLPLTGPLQPTMTILASGNDTLLDICNEHSLTEEQIRAMNPFLKKYLIHTIIPINTLIVVDNVGGQGSKIILPTSSVGRDHVVNTTTTTTNTTYNSKPLTNTKLDSLNRSTTTDRSLSSAPYRANIAGGVPIWECQGRRVLIVRGEIRSHVVSSPQLTTEETCDINTVTDTRDHSYNSHGAPKPKVGSYSHPNGFIRPSNTYQSNNQNNSIGEQHVNNQVALLGPFDELPKYTVLEIDEPSFHAINQAVDYRDTHHDSAPLSPLGIRASPPLSSRSRSDYELLIPFNSQSAHYKHTNPFYLSTISDMNPKSGVSNSSSVSKRQVLRLIEQKATMLMGLRFFCKWRLFVSLCISSAIGLRHKYTKGQTLKIKPSLFDESDNRHRNSMEFQTSLDYDRPNAQPKQPLLSPRQQYLSIDIPASVSSELYHVNNHNQKQHIHSPKKATSRRNSPKSPNFSTDEPPVTRTTLESNERNRYGGVHHTGGLRSPLKQRTALQGTYNSHVSYNKEVSSIRTSPVHRSPLRDHPVIPVPIPGHHGRAHNNSRHLQRTHSPLVDNKQTVRNSSRQYTEPTATSIGLKSPESRGHRRSIGVLLRNLTVARVSDIAAAAGVRVNDLVLRIDGVLVCSSSIFQFMIDQSKGPNVSVTLQTPTGSRFTVVLPIIYVTESSQERERTTTTTTTSRRRQYLSILECHRLCPEVQFHPSDR